MGTLQPQFRDIVMGVPGSNRSRPGPGWACILIVWSALSLTAAAQTGNQGSVAGTLTDPTGLPVAGVRVEALLVATATRFVADSDEEGVYRFPALPVGLYELRAEHAGFATLVVPNLEVGVGARVNLPLRFRMATPAESVVVVGTPPIIETSRTQQSTVVDNRSISSLPVNGRDFAFFALLTPGVNADARGGLSFGGQRAMNSLLVDGIGNDDSFWGQPDSGFDLSQYTQPDYHIGLDAIREFQVNANAYSAELGRAGGGVINAVTRSGTNEFHGSAFWFYRDRALNANDVVSKLNHAPKPPYHFNQAGGAVGGPILKSRLFFFADYDVLRSELTNPVSLNLPAGFKLDADPVVARYQTRALDYLGARAFSWQQPFTQDDYLAKVDWQAAERHRVNVLWNRQSELTGAQVNNPQTAFERADRVTMTRDTIGGSVISVLGSRVHEFRAAYARADSLWEPNSINPEARVFEGGRPVLQVGRAPARPQSISIRHFQIIDLLSVQTGHHNWKLGVDVALDRIAFMNAPTFSGSYRFESLESFGRSLAGTPVPQQGEFFRQAFSGLGTPGSTTHPDMVQYAGFVEDAWRLRPDLLLNLGLRYDTQVNANAPVRNPSPQLAAAGIDTSLIRTDKNNFAPRVGIAWSQGRDRRFVVRLGYGIFYAPTPAVLTARAHYQNGISVQLRTFGADDRTTRGLIPAYPNSVCGPPDPGGLPPSCPPPAAGGAPPVLMPFASNFRQPYVQQGSVGIEGEPRKGVALSVTYLVFKGSHLQRVRDVNLAGTIPSAIGVAGSTEVLVFRRFTSPRPMQDFGRVLSVESAASSIYHGLAVQARKSWSKGFQLMGSYTFSKVIDDNPNVYAINPGGTDSSLVADPSNPGADRGPGDNDQRHRLVLSGILEAGHWQLSGMVTAQSGLPYSGMVGFDLNNDWNSDADRTPGLGRNTYRRSGTISILWTMLVCVALSAPLLASDLSASCQALLSLGIPDTELTSATVVGQTATLPAHCRVVGVTHGEPGSNVGVEVRMPDSWNGKLLFTTRQGFMGAFPPVGNGVVTAGLTRHYAIVTTDSGHVSSSIPPILDASFGLNNRPAEIDYGYRAVHLAKVVGSVLITAFYGSGPVHSYYSGCSSSGRYAIQAAEHYPGDFDGIIAGSPVLDLSGLNIGLNWNMQATLATPIPSEKLPMIFNAVTAACDGLDGLVDGLIEDPRECQFDLNTLLCPAGDAPDCLTAEQIATLEKIYAGPSRSATAAEDPGEQIYPGFAFGGELPDPVGGQGWDSYVTGVPGALPLQLTLMDQYLRYLAFDPDEPEFDWRTFNFDTDPARMETMHEIMDAVQDDLRPFADAGGKMIITQGWGDIAQSPFRTIEYYRGLRRHLGRRDVEDFARLFMAPGMYHCGGGVGPNTFDALTAIEQWVEGGQAPSSIVASHTAGPGANRTRPLCPYPQHAVYKGTGSIDDAANFECTGPHR